MRFSPATALTPLTRTELSTTASRIFLAIADLPADDETAGSVGRQKADVPAVEGLGFSDYLNGL
jgi:hypothetical protein